MAKKYQCIITNLVDKHNQPIIDVPEHAPNNNRAFMHLTQTKQLDKEIVNELLNNGWVYQSDKTILDTQEYQFMQFQLTTMKVKKKLILSACVHYG